MASATASDAKATKRRPAEAVAAPITVTPPSYPTQAVQAAPVQAAPVQAAPVVQAAPIQTAGVGGPSYPTDPSTPSLGPSGTTLTAIDHIANNPAYFASALPAESRSAFSTSPTPEGHPWWWYLGYLFKDVRDARIKHAYDAEEQAAAYKNLNNFMAMMRGEGGAQASVDPSQLGGGGEQTAAKGGGGGAAFPTVPLSSGGAPTYHPAALAPLSSPSPAGMSRADFERRMRELGRDPAEALAAINSGQQLVDTSQATGAATGGVPGAPYPGYLPTGAGGVPSQAAVGGPTPPSVGAAGVAGTVTETPQQAMARRGTGAVPAPGEGSVYPANGVYPAGAGTVQTAQAAPTGGGLGSSIRNRLAPGTSVRFAIPKTGVAVTFTGQTAAEATTERDAAWFTAHDRAYTAFLQGGMSEPDANLKAARAAQAMFGGYVPQVYRPALSRSASTPAHLEEARDRAAIEANKPRPAPSEQQTAQIQTLDMADLTQDLGERLVDARGAIGPITGRITKLNQLRSVNPAAYDAFIAANSSLRNLIVYMRSGKQINEAEADRLLEEIPNYEKESYSTWINKFGNAVRMVYRNAYNRQQVATANKQFDAADVYTPVLRSLETQFPDYLDREIKRHHGSIIPFTTGLPTGDAASDYLRKRRLTPPAPTPTP